MVIKTTTMKASMSMATRMLLKQYAALLKLYYYGSLIRVVLCRKLTKITSQPENIVQSETYTPSITHTNRIGPHSFGSPHACVHSYVCVYTGV